MYTFPLFSPLVTFKLQVGLFLSILIDLYANFYNDLEPVIKEMFFLVLNNNDLEIINLPNQDNPYLYGMVPLIALDMWEHSYYLKYQNNKEQYIKNFFSIIDFNKIEEIYEKEIQKNK